MMETKEEQYGQLALTNIFASVWLGDWDRYEAIFAGMDGELKDSFPFHFYYERENVGLWHENHFSIPGNYFVSPYFSSYPSKKDGGEKSKKELLCLIGMYEKLGFYFPIQQELFPDHIGCLTSFLAAIQQEKIKADDTGDSDLSDLLSSLEGEIALKYILPIIENIQQQGLNKMQHPFLRDFLSFFHEVIREEYRQKTTLA